MVAFDWAPTVDISENNEELVINAEIPGVNKDDVKVSIEDATLTEVPGEDDKQGAGASQGEFG